MTSLALPLKAGPFSLPTALALFAAATLAAACDNTSAIIPSDAGFGGDAGAQDSGTADAGGSDAGASDAGTNDAGSDAGASDAGDDAGSINDAGSDAGSLDAGLIDGGEDAGSIDAGTADGGSDAGVTTLPARCNGTLATIYLPLAHLPATPAITVPSGFSVEAIASIGSARELAALPNGDLLVATDGTTVSLIPNAESDGNPGAPVTFTTINDSPTQGITYDATSCTIYVATQHGVYSIGYVDAQTSGTGSKIASVRTGGISGTDGDVHTTTSVSVANGLLYAGVGSSCNACVESDPTRAVVMQFELDGGSPATKATRFRNAIALATNPATQTLWAGGAGQDDLPVGHPYEFIDPVTLHSGIADYGWPNCEENQNPYIGGSDCSGTVEPRVELPAYSTIIGAVFYPVDQSGTYTFPTANRGLYLAAHGSWHASATGVFDATPQVAFVTITGDVPATAVNWADITDPAQSTTFLGGCETADGKTRVARPTGIAVGPRGTLFVADDLNGLVYRVRPQ